MMLGVHQTNLAVSIQKAEIDGGPTGRLLEISLQICEPATSDYLVPPNWEHDLRALEEKLLASQLPTAALRGLAAFCELVQSTGGKAGPWYMKWTIPLYGPKP